MTRTVVNTKDAPSAVGPYSQAIIVDDYVFSSGQIGLDPVTGNLKSTLEEQTEQVMSNLSAVLSAAGSNVNEIVKTTIFLTDINDFATVNEIYAKAFDGEPPARSTVQVVGLPLGALVEIEAIAKRS